MAATGAFESIADLLPEAMLLVGSDGVVTHANQAAAGLFQLRHEELVGRSFCALSGADSAAALALLRASSRSRSPVPGSLRLDTAHGPGTPCRCEGVVYRPRSGTAPAIVMLRITTRAAGASQFIALNLRIEQMSREIARRRAAEEALRAQSDRLRVTLESIGDAVVVTDDAGRITLMNPVAQALTGWPLDDAIGRPLGEVFRIVNEFTRDTVESPVDKVLREGRVVGLANHTLLIARDGTERPIDDSGAPIKDWSGAVIGVVLVFHDITERHEIERELHRKTLKLEEADKRKDEFLSMLAHELRNPLAPLTTGVHLLRRSSPSPESVSRIAEMMGRQLGHMSRLVDDLLDVARLTRGSAELRKGSVLLEQVVEQAIEVSRPLMDSKQLRLSCEPVPGIRLEADMTRLVQVFGNLLNNAAKYTPPGGAIHVDSRVDGDVAVVTVSDSGEGMSAELLPHIFDLFTQGRRSLDRAQGGLGVGLTVVRAIVEMHGGQVLARSDGAGRGSMLEVRLPLATSASASASGPASASASGSELPHALREAVGGSLRILVVDDNADAAEMLSAAVAGWGHEVTSVTDSVRALPELLRNGADVVLLDIGMPGIDGYALAREIKRSGTVRHPLLVAVTGYGREGDRLAGLKAGFDEYLTKPVNLGELERLLRLTAERSGKD